MADISILTPYQGCVPGSCQQVAHSKLFGSASRGISILAITLFLLSASSFIALALTIGEFDPSIIQGGFRFGTWEAAAGLVAFPATIVLHELLHGSTMRVGETRHQYGVLPEPLAPSTTGLSMRVWRLGRASGRSKS